jgi:hypothetical protein
MGKSAITGRFDRLEAASNSDLEALRFVILIYLEKLNGECEIWNSAGLWLDLIPELKCMDEYQSA